MAQGLYVGVDGCRYGWFSVGLDEEGGLAGYGVHETFDDLMSHHANACMILVDIPIGLPQGPGGRDCDREARKKLGRRRQSSVFSAPTRQAVQEVVKSNSYKAASRVQCEVTQKGLSKQTFNIMCKIAQVDKVLEGRDADARPEVREVHPEVCFWALNGRKPMSHNKKIREGKRERLDVLKCHLPKARGIYKGLARGFPSSQVDDDDIIDALAAAVTGWLGKTGRGRMARLPCDSPPKDCRGLPMEVVYWEPP